MLGKYAMRYNPAADTWTPIPGYISGVDYRRAESASVFNRMAAQVQIFGGRGPVNDQLNFTPASNTFAFDATLPFAIFIVAVSDQYVLQSWRIGERSQESSGLPALWLQKALIPTMALLLGLQALARAARFAAFLAGAPAPGENQHGAVA